MATLIVMIILVLVLCIHVMMADKRYCHIATCSNQPHTACICVDSSKCPSDIVQRGVTRSEKRAIINEHDRLRQKLASGQETRGSPGPQPPAKSMPYLSWDYELEAIAQRWANHCLFQHDQCRDVERFRVGQNIASKSTTDSMDVSDFKELVKGWYEEVQYFDKNEVSRFRSGEATNGHMVGHYTQLVWAKTTLIGCGVLKYRMSGMNTLFLVCNYGPSGNVLGDPIYEIR